MTVLNKFLMIILLCFVVSIVSAAEKLNDPTKPPTNAIKKTAKKQTTHFKLSEIKITANDKQAVINGKRVRKGNQIANFKIKKIAVGYVILSNEKENLRLNLVNSRIIRKKL